MIKKKTFGFPISYGDTPCDEGDRLSDTFVTVVKTKKFQNICSGFFSAVLWIGSQAQVAGAIPPEAGEQVANAADAAINAGQANDLRPHIPEGARIAAGVANAPGPPPLDNQNHISVQEFPPAPGLTGGPGGPGGPPAPGNPPVYMPLGRPITPVSRTANSIMFTGSLAWICVNAYWGNPVAMAGCAIMFATWFGTVLGINIGR